RVRARLALVADAAAPPAVGRAPRLRRRRYLDDVRADLGVGVRVDDHPLYRPAATGSRARLAADRLARDAPPPVRGARAGGARAATARVAGRLLCASARPWPRSADRDGAAAVRRRAH